jgi:hypothetical protein
MKAQAATSVDARAVACALVLVLGVTVSIDAKSTSAKRVKKHKEVGLASWYGPGFTASRRPRARSSTCTR